MRCRSLGNLWVVGLGFAILLSVCHGCGGEGGTAPSKGVFTVEIRPNPLTWTPCVDGTIALPFEIWISETGGRVGGTVHSVGSVWSDRPEWQTRMDGNRVAEAFRTSYVRPGGSITYAALRSSPVSLPPGHTQCPSPTGGTFRVEVSLIDDSGNASTISTEARIQL